MVKPKSETVVVCFRFRLDQLRAAFEAELFKRCATGDTATASWCTANWPGEPQKPPHVHTMIVHSGVVEISTVDSDWNSAFYIFLQRTL